MRLQFIGAAFSFTAVLSFSLVGAAEPTISSPHVNQVPAKESLPPVGDSVREWRPGDPVKVMPDLRKSNNRGIGFEKMRTDCMSVSELTIHHEACIAAVTYAEKRLAMYREALKMTEPSGLQIPLYGAEYQRALNEIKNKFPYVWENRVMID